LVNGNGHNQNLNQNNGLNDNQEESTYNKFLRVWWLVRRKFWIVILFALLGATYEYNNIVKVKELYRSKASVILDGSATDRAVALLGVPGASYGYDNELIILRSNQLANKVANSLLDNFNTSRKLDTLEILKSSGGGIDNLDQIAKRVKNSVSFQTGNEEESIIYIYATAHDPQDAAVIANTYAHTYENNNVKNSVQQVQKAKQYVDSRIQQANDSLISTEFQILEFYRKHGYTRSELDSDALLDQMTELYKQLDKARFELASNREQIASIDSTLKNSRESETDIILGATDNLISYYEDKIKELSVSKEEEIAKLSSTDSDKTNNIIKNINKKLDNYRQKLKNLLEKKLDNSSLLSTVDGSIAKYWIELQAKSTELQNETNALREKISEIEEQVEIYDQRLDTMPLLEMELDKLERKRENYFSLLQKFYNRKVEIELAEVSEGGYVSLLDAAKPNHRPINKKKMAGVLQGGFFGIVLAVLFIVGLDKIDDRIKSDEDLEQLNANVISSIPDMDAILAKEYKGKDFIDFKGAFISTKLVTALKPLSGVSEMYRRLRTKFLFSQPDKKKKSILVSSSNPKEGKSLSAANLAIVLANSGKKVALVDGDLRRPNLDILFGVTKKPGLSNLIVEDLHLDDIIRTTIIDNLSLIPAGNNVPNPSELLGSEAFRSLYQQLNNEFDYVVIDSAPINSVVDAVTISEVIDQILLVVNVGKTKKKDVKQSLDLLQVVQGKISGILLNKIGKDSYLTDYNYYKNYNYYGNEGTMNDEIKNKGLGNRIDV